MSLLKITEGWTDRLGPFVLQVDGDDLDLTNLDCELILRGPTGSLVQFQGDVVVDPDQSLNRGHVYLDPEPADFKAGAAPNTIHFKITDSNGKVAFWPNGRAEEIEVFKP